MKYETLYYYDTAGRLRSWYVEVEGDAYRTVSGLDDGKKVISEWKTAKPKNTGKKNATTGEEQAHAEAKALYVKARKQGCSEDINTITVPYIQPMLADKMKGRKKPLPFGEEKIWVQPKFDGFRCLVTKLRMHSRSGETFLNCGHIHAKLMSFLENNDNIVQALDGELYNHEYHDNFNKLSSLIRKETVTPVELVEIRSKVQFHCYDFVPVDPTMTYEQRRNFLDNLLPTGLVIYFAPTYQVNSIEQIDNFKAQFVDQGYEGAIIRINGPYEHKRSKNLIKYKRLEDSEFEVVSILEGKGNWSGMAKSVEIKLPNGETCRAGMRGDEEFCRKLLENANYWVGKMVTVEYDGFTPDGALRFPIVTKWHDGKLEKR